MYIFKNVKLVSSLLGVMVLYVLKDESLNDKTVKKTGERETEREGGKKSLCAKRRGERGRRTRR